MRVKERVKEWVYEWLGRRRSRAHIEEEWKRHHTIALLSCEYIGFLLLSVSIYFLREGKFTFHYFFLALALLYLSNWAPDLLYLFFKLVRRDRSYIPSHKRKYTHGYAGLFFWTFFTCLVSLTFAEIFWVMVFTSLAFTGYWLHLTTDKVELFVDRIAEFVERALKGEENEKR